ncbi:protein kinase activating protein dpb11 [Rhizina undulata]
MADQLEIAQHSHPLRQYIICCTSIPPEARQELVRKAEEMGARHVLDLTSEVTHLICGEICTPKYKYVARMRPDVKVMKQDWVDAMYKLWLSGEDINAEDFAKEYKFPTFHGLRISLTGIHDLAERKRIEDICSGQAATYHPDLTKLVTHLITAAPTGKKYEFARLNEIFTIAPEWFWDSLERGMALEESYYSPVLPPEKIGAGAKPVVAAPPPEALELHGKRKIRRTAEEKLGSNSQSIWGDIMGQAASIKPKKQNEWEDAGGPQSPRKIDAQRALSVDKNAEKQDALNNNFIMPDKEMIFQSATFYLHGFSRIQKETIREYLIPHGAKFTSSIQELRALGGLTSRLLLVVPHNLKKQDYPDVSDDFEINIVTEWWIEACLYGKCFIEPSALFTYSPIENFPLEGFKGMEICVTMFAGVEYLHLTKLIILLGANFHDVLSRKRTLLISDTPPKGEKYHFAIENDIPVVTMGWLHECIKQSKKVPYEGFLLERRKKPRNQQTPASPVVDSEIKKRVRSEATEEVSNREPKATRLPPRDESAPRSPLKRIREKIALEPQTHKRRQTAEPPESPEKVPAQNSGIGKILGKIGKESLTTAMDQRKRRREKLQGKLSRVSSTLSSRDGSVPPSELQPSCEGIKALAPRALEELNDLSSTPTGMLDHEPPAPSQAIRYADPEAEKEKKSIRAKLSGDSMDVDTPKTARRSRAIGAAVDLDGVKSRTRGAKRNG